MGEVYFLSTGSSKIFKSLFLNLKAPIIIRSNTGTQIQRERFLMNRKSYM